ncbi:MAG: cystatin domain-containing protein [archaeon]|nr:cystatin domain-containing protein [archaeon]
MSLGAFTDGKPMNAQVKEIAMAMKAKAEEKLGATYSVYEPESFKTQVVAGTNYLIQINVDGGKKIQIKVFKPLPCNGTELELLEANAL